MVSEQSFRDEFLLLQVVKGFSIASPHCIYCTLQTLFSVCSVVAVVIVVAGGVVYLEQAIEDNVLLLARCRNECTYGLRLFIPEPSATCFIFQIPVLLRLSHRCECFV